MAATVLFNEDSVKITDEALLYAGHTLPLAEIQAVQATEGRELRVAVGLAVAGVVLVLVGVIRVSGAALSLGVMLAVVGYLAWLVQAPTHRLVVRTAQGESEVIATRDGDQVRRMVAVLRRAGAP